MSEPEVLNISGLKNYLKDFLHILEDTIVKEENIQSELEKDVALKMRLAEELKQNAEFKDNLKHVSKLQSEMDKLSERLKNNITLKDSDENRLNKAKKMYTVAKQFTGIKFDFKASPNVWKGYVKNKSTKILDVFELDIEKQSSSEAEDKLWKYIENAALTDWALIKAENAKENRVPNNVV